MPDETIIEDDEEAAEAPEAEVIPTDDLESLDDIHAVAAYNRRVMGPEAEDGTIVSGGTELPVEPGPGPEDNEALDAATGGALSAAAETGPHPIPEPLTGQRADFPVGVSGITGAPEGDEGEEGEEGGAFDPGDHTVAEVLDYIAAHPEEEEAVLAAEESGKGRAGILG